MLIERVGADRFVAMNLVSVQPVRLDSCATEKERREGERTREVVWELMRRARVRVCHLWHCAFTDASPSTRHYPSAMITIIIPVGPIIIYPVQRNQSPTIAIGDHVRAVPYPLQRRNFATSEEPPPPPLPL